MNFTFLAAVAFAAIIGVGCSDSSSPDTMMPTPNLVVSPADGQANVRLDAAVTFTFARPVDRAIVERAVHLISERMMADSLCPDTSMMSHGGMGNVMMDSSLMRHMGDVHATRGRFAWRGDSTECYFRPDSMMTPRTQYMIHMGREVMQMMRDRMGDMRTMSGHGSGMMEDHMMFHFATLDTAGGGGGHAGHH